MTDERLVEIEESLIAATPTVLDLIAEVHRLRAALLKLHAMGASPQYIEKVLKGDAK